MLWAGFVRPIAARIAPGFRLARAARLLIACFAQLRLAALERFGDDGIVERDLRLGHLADRQQHFGRLARSRILTPQARNVALGGHHATAETTEAHRPR